MSEAQLSVNRWKFIKLTLLAWLAMFGLDFFFHGGLFAQLYEQDSPFILSAEEAFRRIPLGYLALLATSALLVWIVERSSARGWRKGFVLGLALGTVMAFSSVLGLYSISTASAQLLAAWFVAQLIQFALAGAVIGQGLSVQSLRRLTFAIVFGLVLLFVGTVIIQNTGISFAA